MNTCGDVGESQDFQNGTKAHKYRTEEKKELRWDGLAREEPGESMVNMSVGWPTSLSS